MLESISITDFRCIEQAEIIVSPELNLIVGPNASGKTSLLEAIFFLGRARSFRTARIGPLIRDGAAELQVAGRIRQGDRPIPVGIRRGRRAGEARIAGQPTKSLAELSEAFPVQVLDPSVHGLVDGGPRERRRFLDWGVFHVERPFHQAWQRYSRALRQRNSEIRASGERRLAGAWDTDLAAAGERLDAYRRSYLAALAPNLERIAGRLLAIDEPVTVEYAPGWPDDLGLAEALDKGWQRDRQAGSTQVGPHRADLVLRVGTHRAQDRVSRGQQKVLAGALVLAQLAEYHRRTGRAAALLADDIPAELDRDHLGRFLALAREGTSQLFLTAIHAAALPAETVAAARVFHVEHGRIKSPESP